MGVEIIQHYFPNLSNDQTDKFKSLFDLYQYWNNQINVISRKDFEAFYERHVLHSLSIAKVIQFTPGTSVLDVGTGGGFPGLPLAILFPESNFHLVDSIGKKIKVVNEVASAIHLTNLKATHDRAENIKEQFDFVISRAVTQMKDFLPWVKNKFKQKQQNGYPNGIFYLKGGDLKDELSGIKNYMEIINLSDFFKEEFFETKKLVYVQMT